MEFLSFVRGCLGMTQIHILKQTTDQLTKKLFVNIKPAMRRFHKKIAKKNKTTRINSKFRKKEYHIIINNDK